MSYDCQSCGACCFSDSTSYVEVTGNDHDRLGEEGQPLTHFVGNRCYMRMEGGHCVALTRVGRRFACSIYERRPATCRELHRGSPACKAEITLKKARALRVLEG